MFAIFELSTILELKKARSSLLRTALSTRVHVPTNKSQRCKYSRTEHDFFACRRQTRINIESNRRCWSYRYCSFLHFAFFCKSGEW